MTVSLPTLPGYHDLGLSLAGHEVKVTVHVPATSLASRPALLALHYGGPPTGHYGRGLLEQLVIPATRDLGMLVAAPVVLDGDWRGAASTDVVLALADALRALGDGRCLLVGYSLGALGCWHLLAEAATRFAGVIPIAGAAPTQPADFPTPVWVLHSEADELFPAEPLRATLEALQSRGNPLRWQFLPGLSHYAVGQWREALGAAVRALLEPP